MLARSAGETMRKCDRLKLTPGPSTTLETRGFSVRSSGTPSETRKSVETRKSRAGVAPRLETRDFQTRILGRLGLERQSVVHYMHPSSSTRFRHCLPARSQSVRRLVRFVPNFVRPTLLNGSRTGRPPRCGTRWLRRKLPCRELPQPDCESLLPPTAQRPGQPLHG